MNPLTLTFASQLRFPVLLLILISQLLATLGFPVPRGQFSELADAVIYPCQDRPCGCVSATACWAGDCCCYTLEEKLIWAEERGIEPPPHVRPLVESRRLESRAASLKGCCKEKPSSSQESQIHWVTGVYSRDCRGHGPEAVNTYAPNWVEHAPVLLLEPVTVASFELPQSEPLISVTQVPASPPPKFAAIHQHI